MTKYEENLLNIYGKGWIDQADSKDNSKDYSGDELIAYEFGSLDYYHGDNLESLDSQTNEEILKKILEK